MKIEFSEKANLDLWEITNYLIEEAGQGVALKIIEEIDQTIDMLADNPLAGFKVRVLPSKKLRYFPAGKNRNYNIYYRQPNEEMLFIVRVLHARRNIESLLIEAK